MGPLPWGGGLDSKPASLRERLAATQPGHFKTQFKFCLPATSHPPLNTLLTAVTVWLYGSNLKVAESWNPPRKAELLYCLNWFIFFFFCLNFLLNLNAHVRLHPLLAKTLSNNDHKYPGHESIFKVRSLALSQSLFDLSDWDSVHRDGNAFQSYSSISTAIQVELYRESQKRVQDQKGTGFWSKINEPRVTNSDCMQCTPCKKVCTVVKLQHCLFCFFLQGLLASLFIFNLCQS